MSVDTSAETVIGIRFSSHLKAVEYALENNLTITDDVDDLNEDLINDLEWVEYSGYSEEGGVIGIRVNASDLDYMKGKVDIIWRDVWEVLPDNNRDDIMCHMFVRLW